MKKFWFIFCLLVLCGCGNSNREIDRALEFRNKLLAAPGCSFESEISADYNVEVHRFTVDNQGDELGNVVFTVTYPESIAGIRGKLGSLGGEITFENDVLAFPLLAEGQLSPVSAPWLFLKTLRSGYLKSACMEDNYLHLVINDSYEDDAVMMDVWLDENDCPVFAEFLYKGSKIITMNVKNFLIL